MATIPKHQAAYVLLYILDFNKVGISLPSDSVLYDKDVPWEKNEHWLRFRILCEKVSEFAGYGVGASKVFILTIRVVYEKIFTQRAEYVGVRGFNSTFPYDLTLIPQAFQEFEIPKEMLPRPYPNYACTDNMLMYYKHYANGDVPDYYWNRIMYI